MHPTMTRLRAALLLLLALPALGCGGRLPPLADPDQARNALTLALDTWKSGAAVEELARRRPPVYFNDPKCAPDVRLVAYRLDDGHEVHGQSIRLTAHLTLAVKGAAETERKAKYLIDTSPVTVIVAE